MVRSNENYETIYKHVEEHLGPVAGVFQEILSDELTIDIIVAAPTKERNCYTLVTSGISEIPFTVPDGAESYRYAELTISLPPTWKISDEDFKDERNYWPIRALKTIGRFPHEYNTWLYYGHTVANGNPPAPYSSDAKFQGMLVWVPEAANATEFFNLSLSEEKVVHFFSLIPLYQDEIEFKVKNGQDALLEKLGRVGADQIVNVNRKNACKKLFGLF
ncbi:suppressor of fused domain protein [Paenibacillus sp. NPDC058071]|uniref:suppressor of fused domain protein n=1 Tax=Paenibacillus sp. NPDC058071 TaxID=3346326 RepID=UPI0036DB7859